MFDRLFTYNTPHADWQLYIILGIGILLVILALWFVYRRPRRWWLRLPLYLLTIGSLLVIGLAPQTTQQLGTKKVIVSTPGTTTSTLDSLKKEIGEEVLIYHLSDSSHFDDVGQLHIPNLAHLTTIRQDIETLWLTGNGLSKDDLPYLAAFNTKLALNPLPTGIQALNWTRSLQEGEEFIIEGRFLNQGDKAVQLSLEGLGGVIETLSIKAKSEQDFRFKTVVKASGKYLFQLVSQEGKKTPSKEQIPFIVYPLKKDKQLLILLSQPSFETRFLKKWLSEKGYPLAIQSQISKDQFHTEYLNMQQSGKFLLNAERITPFNVFILDHLRAQQLNDTELSLLKNKVNKSGAAVLTLVDEQQLAQEGNPNWFLRFPTQKSFRAEGQEELLQIPATKHPIELPIYQIASGFNTTPISTTLKGQMIVASKQYGLGKYAISLLPKSYLWTLEGYSADYTLFWDRVLEALESHYAPTSKWQVQEAFPRAKESIHFKLQSSSKEPPSIQLHDGTNPSGNLPLAQSVNQEAWTGKVWTERAGWHRLEQGGDNYSFYVYPTRSWDAYYTAQKIKQTQAALDQTNISKKTSSTLQIPEKTHDVSLHFWYILFVLTLFLLWIEAKFQSFPLSSRRIN